MANHKAKAFKSEQGVYYLGRDLNTIHIGTVVTVNFAHPGFVYVRNDGKIWCLSEDKVFTNKRAFLESMFENARFVY